MDALMTPAEVAERVRRPLTTVKFWRATRHRAEECSHRRPRSVPRERRRGVDRGAIQRRRGPVQRRRRLKGRLPDMTERPAGGGALGATTDREVTSSISPAPPTTTTDALAAIARGWSIFPVLPDDKRPVITDWENRATRRPDIIGKLWPADHNVGVACGPSGLVVVDLDCGKPLTSPWDAMSGIVDGQDVLAVLCERHDPEWPSWPDWRSTYTVQTPSGGWHLYFKATSDEIRNSTAKLGPLIDIRAAGGYVVGAGR